MNTFVLVQILGAITLILSAISLQQRKKENLLLIFSCAAALFVIQYFLTNKITGAVLFIIVFIRGLVFFYFKKKNLKPSIAVFVIFQVVTAISTYLTWQNIYSIIPFLATVSATYGMWQDNMKHTRKAMLFTKSSLIFYNFIAGMYTGMITNVVDSVSLMIAMHRFDRKNPTNPQSHNN